MQGLSNRVNTCRDRIGDHGRTLVRCDRRQAMPPTFDAPVAAWRWQLFARAIAILGNHGLLALTIILAPGDAQWQQRQSASAAGFRRARPD
jgi:hypothetical protein